MTPLEYYTTLNPISDEDNLNDWINGFLQQKETNRRTTATASVAAVAITAQASSTHKPKKTQSKIHKYFPSRKSKPKKYTDESERASKKMTSSAPSKKVLTPSFQEPTCQEYLNDLKTVRNETRALADLLMIRCLLNEITEEAILRECIALISKTAVALQINHLPDIAHDLALLAPDLTLSFSKLALYLAKCNAPRFEMERILNKIEDHEKRDIVCLVFLRALIAIRDPGAWDTQYIYSLLTGREAKISAKFFLCTPHVLWNALRPGLNFSTY